jgi:hypothetical protein
MPWKSLLALPAAGCTAFTYSLRSQMLTTANPGAQESGGRRKRRSHT